MESAININESSVRQIAAKHGCIVRKSRARTIHGNDLGEYMLVNAELNCVVVGEKFDASLEDIHRWLTTD